MAVTPGSMERCVQVAKCHITELARLSTEQKLNGVLAISNKQTRLGIFTDSNNSILPLPPPRFGHEKQKLSVVHVREVVSKHIYIMQHTS